MIGLIGALELVKDKVRRQIFPDPGEVGVLCRDLCIANGLVMRAVRDTMIIAPPLVITREQVDELVDKARRALDQTREELHRQGKL
jgi:putrescine aminotransferase